jgi:hypothetical protein
MCGAFLPILNQTTARNGVAMAVRPDTTTKSSAPISANAEEDLEQYGVWVKAEPQDIIEEPEVVSLEDSDFGIPSAEPLSAEDNLLSSDEDKLIGSFERLDSSPASMAASLDSGMESLPPLEDFEIPDAEAGIEELGAATIDISLDDLEPQSPISPSADIDLSTVRGLEEEASSIEFSPSEEGKAMPGEIEDVSAEFLDIMEPSSGNAERDVTAEFLGDGAVSEPASEPEPEFEPIDMELHFDETLNGAEGFAESSNEPGFETVSEFDDFLHEEKTSPDAASGRMPPAFDDLEAVERELSEPSPSAAGGRPAASRPGASPALANDLLERIASELSSIRGELVTLKSQIGSLKAEEGTAPQAEAEEPKSKAAAGGFFDEEEDETIALTGDELDNILNTADFTEETPGEEGPAIDVDLGSVSLEEESILPESGDYQLSEALPGIEEIHLEPSEAALEEPPANDFPEIEIMAEEGVNPLTQAPEDTSYLEEPLEAVEEIDLSEIPLHEEALGAMPGIPEEAELIEETEEVPAIQEEELPEIEAFEDLTLGMEAKPGYMPEAVEEARPVEALPEIEDIDFGEISLAEESSASVEEVEEVEEAEEVEELDVMEDDLSPAATSTIEDSELAARLEASTIKPAEPVSFHPDEIPMDLDDSFFVGAPEATLPEELETVEAPAPAKKAEAPKAAQQPPMGENDRLKNEIRGVLSYLDKLLESLPESKIDEFAHSEYFDTYKKLFEELGLV